MTFALGPRARSRWMLATGSSAWRKPHVGSAVLSVVGRRSPEATSRHLHRARRPPRPARLRAHVAHGVEHRGREDRVAPIHGFVHAERSGHAARVALRRAGARERGAAVGGRREHVPREQALGERRVLVRAGSDAA